uniref:Small ribosomal subunit protein mS23 n=1 Tax=Saccoglossus kowalevskii TaxID=10224 RepID=A0ABM0MT52_SACKO|nr:PREDICTED: 28S ribosomal protein S23, mitochondrial-like [Saccoglossus kowalevskii]
MKAGVIKEKNKPVWFDVMKAFPPLEEPLYLRKIDKRPLPNILYPEDKIRAQFYQVYGSQGAIDLKNKTSIAQSLCHIFIQKYQELEKKDDVDCYRLFNLTVEELAREGLVLKKRRKYSLQSKQSDKEKRFLETQPIKDPKITDMIKKALQMAEHAEKKASNDEVKMFDTNKKS